MMPMPKKSALTLMISLATGLGTPQLLAAGDPEAGKKVFKQCKSCHKIGEGAKNATGPILTGIVGSSAGIVEGYKYSKSLKAAGESGLVWTEEALTKWLKNPSGYMKEFLGDDSAKSKMTKKLKKDQQISDVIAYMASFPAGASAEAVGQATTEVAASMDHDEEADTPVRGPGNRFAEENSLPQPGDDNYEIAEFGTAEDLEFMDKVIAVMHELRLMDGPDAIQAPVFPGTRPHGIILGTVITNAEIDGRVGELIVKRSFEHPEAETNTNKALEEVQADPDKYLANYAVMYRRENGYQDAHNNWYYAEFEPAGEVIVYEGNTLVGRNDLCISCHVLAEGEDYLFVTNGIK